MSKEEFFLEGKKCFSSQKYDEAIKLFEQALALDQNYIDAYNYMARSFQESRRSDKAAECYYQEGEIWYNLGNYEEASLAYNRVIVFDDKRTDVYCKQVDTLSLLIENYNKEGNERSFAEGIAFYVKASSCYFRLIKLPKNANVDISNEKIKMTQVIFDIAKKYYTESKSLYSLDKNTSFEYYVDAIKLYKDITKINNEAREEYSAIWSRDADLILELAQDYINKGDALYTSKKYDARKYYDKAIEFYQEVTKVDINKLENGKEYYDKLISFSLYNAKHFHKKGDALYQNKQTGDFHYQYKIAINLYEQFIDYKKDEKIDPDIVRAQLSIYGHLGEEDKINKIIYNSNISLDMKAEAYYQKALLNYKEAKSNESLERTKSSFEKVIKTNQNHAEAYCMLGYISHRLGNEYNALTMFEKALSINPLLDIALNGKGVALLYLDKHEEALQYFQEAVIVNPKLDVAHYNLGILNYELTQDIEIALINFQEAIDINPTALYHCHRAQIYYATGRIKEALEDFYKAGSLADADQYGSNLTIENKKDIIKYLWHERIVLLKQLVTTQELLIKIKEESSDHNPQIQKITKDAKQLEDSLHKLTCEIIKNFTLRNNDSNDEYNKFSYEQTFKFEKELKLIMDRQQDLLNAILELKREKVGKNDVEQYIFIVDKEISINKKLKDYYDALYGKLNVAMKEADVICGVGHIALHTSDIKITVLSAGLNLIPIVGKYIGSGFESGAKVIKSNTIKEQAVKFQKLMGLNPDNKELILKKTAEEITLSKKYTIEKIEDNQEVYNWRDKGLITKCKDFFTANIDDKLYENNAQILGCIDALKIILAITTEQIKPSSDVKEVITQLVEIPSKYTFSDDREIVLKTDENYDSFPIIIGVFDNLNDIEIYPKKSSVLLKDNKKDNLNPNMEPLLSESPEGKISNTSTKKTCCEKLKDCMIFSITEIKYDNPILNHPEMLKTLTNNLSRSLSFWEVVDRVNNFDKEFVEEVCLSGSVELLQECFGLS